MRWTALLLLLAACSGSSTPAYSFPGCDDAGGANAGACADNDVFTCAENSLQAQFASCTQDSDCAIVQLSATCTSSVCGFSVRADSVGVFRDELSNEAERFCKAQSGSGGGCFQNEGDLACSGCEVAVCEDGVCAQTQSTDGGCFFGG